MRQNRILIFLVIGFFIVIGLNPILTGITEPKNDNQEPIRERFRYLALVGSR